MGITTFYVGGCTGFDTMAALAVLDYRKTHPDIHLIVVVPYKGQSKGWSEKEKLIYTFINSSASEVVCLADHYFRGCMQIRNRYMVDNSSVCICYLNKCKGGTVSTVKYAKSKGIPIRNLCKT